VCKGNAEPLANAHYEMQVHPAACSEISRSGAVLRSHTRSEAESERQRNGYARTQTALGSPGMDIQRGIQNVDTFGLNGAHGSKIRAGTRAHQSLTRA
jgi:hypothetical protein